MAFPLEKMRENGFDGKTTLKTVSLLFILEGLLLACLGFGVFICAVVVGAKIKFNNKLWKRNDCHILSDNKCAFVVSISMVSMAAAVPIESTLLPVQDILANLSEFVFRHLRINQNIFIVQKTFDVMVEALLLCFYRIRNNIGGGIYSPYMQIKMGNRLGNYR